MSFSNENYGRLIELQKKFRQGIIKEEDISEEDKENLKKLYHMQIDALEQSIEDDKNKILEIKNKLNSNKN